MQLRNREISQTKCFKFVVVAVISNDGAELRGKTPLCCNVIFTSILNGNYNYMKKKFFWLSRLKQI